MKKIIFTILALVMALAVEAQLVDPVHFTSELKTGKGAEAEIVFHATIDDGWHVYSTDIGKSGPIEATFHVVKLEETEAQGAAYQEDGQALRHGAEVFRARGDLRAEDTFYQARIYDRLLSGVWRVQREELSASVGGGAEAAREESCIEE